MAVTVRVNSAEVQDMLHRFPAYLAYAVRDEWKKTGHDFRKAAAQNFATRHPKRANAAMRWAFDRMTQYRKGPGDPGVGEADAVLGVFISSPKLMIHATGGTITDPSGGAMAIPLGDAVTLKKQRAKKAFLGKNDVFSPQLYKVQRGARRGADFNTFKIINLRGRLFAAEVDAVGDIVSLYARIVKSVKIKPTFGFFETWNRMRTQRDEAIQRATQRTLRNMQNPRWVATIGSTGKRSVQTGRTGAEG